MAYEEHQRQSRQIIARCAVITLSDTRTAENDASGKKIVELLAGGGHFLADYQVIRDDPAALTGLIQSYLARSDVDAILTSGGTGISARDRTIDAIEGMIERPLPGFGELFRMLSWEQISSGAMLSRAIGGISKGKILFAMPGSTGAVELAMSRLILPELGHLIHELRK